MSTRLHADVLFARDAPEQYILLQLEDRLLDQPLEIKASGPGSTVLCTADETYTLREVQQSNSLLFLCSEPADADAADASHGGEAAALRVAGEAASWLETSHIRPQIDLSIVPLYDNQRPEQSLARDTLFASIPASRVELQRALDDAFCIDVDGEQVARAPLQAVVEVLSDICGNVAPDDARLALAVRTLCSTPDGALDVDKICRTAARHVLATQAPCTVDRFMLAWRATAPAAYRDRCVLSLAAGLYLHTTPTTITAMPVLSEDPRTRAAQLFAVRDRWPEKEFTDLGGLVKFARRVRIGRETFVEART